MYSFEKEIISIYMYNYLHEKRLYMSDEMTDTINNIFVIDDLVVETRLSLITTGIVLFPNSKFNIRRFPLTKTISLLQGILNKAKRENAIILHTFVKPELSDYVNNFGKENNL